VDLTLDSRECASGSLFFALGGRRAHGIKFAAEAAARGASVVLWDPEGDRCRMRTRDAVRSANPSTCSWRGAGAQAYGGPDRRSLLRLAVLADAHRGHHRHQRQDHQRVPAGAVPAAPEVRRGVHGHHRLGPHRCARSRSTHTTPDVITVHRQLAKLRAQGVRDVAMEVSSHALDQGRVDGVRFDSAAFTNLTRDHLDYHPSMQAYGEAKARLFAIPELQHVVINMGDAFGRELALRYGGRAPLTAVWVGAGDSGWLADRSLHAAGLVLDLTA
jgi:UDP-N-acetylmuramoyl-L-alanyl-D-glutamate--2,6-diaminopimelate ligase